MIVKMKDFDSMVFVFIENLKNGVFTPDSFLTAVRQLFSFVFGDSQAVFNLTSSRLCISSRFLDCNLVYLI